MEFIEYAIYDYEAFSEKYSWVVGSVTDRCFSVVFNNEYGYIGTHGWE